MLVGRMTKNLTTSSVLPRNYVLQDKVEGKEDAKRIYVSQCNFMLKNSASSLLEVFKRGTKLNEHGKSFSKKKNGISAVSERVAVSDESLFDISGGSRAFIEGEG